MSRQPTRYWQPPGETVERLAERGATGALHGEAGTVHLVDGWVVHVESDRSPGIAGLLTVCGRVSPEAWQETVRTAGPDCRVGRALVEQGRLTRGELEICHLAALHDAAFFVLSTRPAMSWFEPGARHWLGPVRPVSARVLRRETLRRRAALERIWPWPQLDTAPVVPCRPRPVTRPGGVRAAGPRQRQLLDHADGLRTPADLARLLGRCAFATTADVRRLAAAGLVATPAAGRPAVSAPGGAGAAPGRHADVDSDTVELTLAGLERRTPGAALAAAPGVAAARRRGEPVPARRPSHAAAHPLSVPDPDIALLTRVRIALEARL
ncbi:hypothetical protein [Kitasatospora sp. NPDC057223]|uniref:hypothetical protein n=1 Tax=Kitasatospora sp. NPDC057223 TaxID=3346055 RepID=UPI00363A8982